MRIRKASELSPEEHQDKVSLYTNTLKGGLGTFVVGSISFTLRALDSMNGTNADFNPMSDKFAFAGTLLGIVAAGASMARLAVHLPYTYGPEEWPPSN